jgi:ubiquinone/menaquinone biosynthesis C-methylase UbiE/uncharacterized protein YbaR (Trm112 family)
MNRGIVSKLQCPNLRGGSLRIAEIKTDESCNNVIEGVLICPEANTAYPIKHGIVVLLSDSDTDREHHKSLLLDLRNACPQQFLESIDATVERLTTDTDETPTGKWNREEMKYYDARDQSIGSPEQSPIRLSNLQPDWSRLVPRRRYLFQEIARTIERETLLEIGCGTAKTIALGMNPTSYNYFYVGIDVSWQRLMHARAVMPRDSFIQASAMNIPLRSRTVNTVLAFGALHHMANPLDAVRESVRSVGSGGYFGFDEPIHTRKLVPENLRDTVERVLEGYEHSEHDNDIDYKAVKTFLVQHDFETISEIYGASILNLILNNLRRIPILGRTQLLATFIHAMDRVWIHSVGRLSQRLGPRAVLHLSQCR